MLAETTGWLQAEPQKQSIYREEAIDAIVMALEDSLVNKKVREKCCRALHILGGRFSFSGKLLTESWILKQTGFEDSCEVNSLENEDEILLVDDTISWVQFFFSCNDTCPGFLIICFFIYSLQLKVIFTIRKNKIS